MFVHLLRRLRRVLVTVLFLLLLAGSLVVALALAWLSDAPAVRADGLPPIFCPKECPTTTATRAEGSGLPPIWPVGGTLANRGGMPVLATDTMTVVN